jgi:hypothetical protein
MKYVKRHVAVPSQQFAHMRPVFLLDVRVVVLLLGPSPRKLNLPRLAPALQMWLMNSFRCPCPLRAAQRAAWWRYPLNPAVTGSSAPCPSIARDSVQVGMNVGDVERVRELSTGGISRMRNQIGLRKSGSLDIPTIFTGM